MYCTFGVKCFFLSFFLSTEHETSFVIEKSYDLPSIGVAMLDFDELQEFPEMSS